MDCWNYEAFEVARASETGTVDASAITYLEIEIVANGSITTGSILFDHMLATSGGFTLQNTIRGDRKFKDVRLQYKKPTVVLEDFAKMQNFFWYVDYDKDIHFFKKDAKLAPFSLDDTSENFGDLSISVDIADLKNRQTVRGGEAPSESRYTQDIVADGEQASFRLDYPPKDLKVYVDSGSGFVEKTV